MRCSIGEAARACGLSVRALRFYEEKGLIRPARVADNGYREYDEHTLCRIERILILREMDFPVEEIASLLDTPGNMLREAYARQSALLALKRDRLNNLIALLDARAKGEDTMAFDKFSTQNIDEARDAYRAEVKSRWGDTPAYAQSQKRGGANSPEAKAEAEDIFRAFAAIIGEAPEGPAAQAVAQRWRAHLTRWYYDCTPEILRGLADMYDQDERFSTYLDSFGAGTAAFMSATLRAM